MVSTRSLPHHSHTALVHSHSHEHLRQPLTYGPESSVRSLLVLLHHINSYSRDPLQMSKVTPPPRVIWPLLCHHLLRTSNNFTTTTSSSCSPVLSTFTTALTIRTAQTAATFRVTMTGLSRSGRPLAAWSAPAMTVAVLEAPATENVLTTDRPMPAKTLLAAALDSEEPTTRTTHLEESLSRDQTLKMTTY